MTVYHGTTLERAKKIWNCKQIYRTNDEIKRFPTTENGYVYVTDNFVVALEFSMRNIQIGCKETGVVFKIEIDERELVLDQDENDNPTYYDNSVKYISYKIQRNLILGRDVMKALLKEIPYGCFDDYFNKLSRGDIQITESEWHDFTSS